MKYILVVGDGMSDRPVPELNGKTPLEAANTPNMDKIAGSGIAGKFRTIKEGSPAGTDYAHFSIFGMDPKKYYTGRAAIEAVAMVVPLYDDDVALRTNLVYLKDGKMEDYSAGHITTPEARELIKTLNEKLGKKGDIEFYGGISYRHLLALRHKYSDKLITTPPHDISDNNYENFLPKASDKSGESTAKLLNSLMKSSQEILENHPINKKRISEGHSPANSIWFWGHGKKPHLQTFQERFGVKGAIITAVDILTGLGMLLGFDVIKVKGATGYFDTDYKAKGEAAINALKKRDFVFVHVEAPDEAGHIGDYNEKIRAIENIDSKIIGPIIAELEKSKTPFTIAVLPDHATPVTVKTHVPDLVPFAMWNSTQNKSRKLKFCEKNANDLSMEEGFIDLFFKKNKPLN